MVLPLGAILKPTVLGAKISYKEVSLRSFIYYFSLFQFVVLSLIQILSFFFLLSQLLPSRLLYVASLANKIAFGRTCITLHFTGAGILSIKADIQG